MKKQTTIIILISSLIIAGAILGYGYMNYSSKMKVLESERQIKAEEIQREKEKQERVETRLRNCVSKAENDYTAWWNSSCKNLGVDKKTDECQLPSYMADDIVASLDKDIENCVQLYSVDR